MDEQDLREGLRALAVAAPPAPPARAERSVRRSVRMRRTRAAVSVATVVALAVPVGLVLRAPSPGRRATVSDVASWPQRRDPALKTYEDKALADYARLYSPPGPGESVRVLLSTRAQEHVAVAFAYCTSSCSRAVLTIAEVESALGGGPGDIRSFWVSVTADVVDGALARPLVNWFHPRSNGRAGPTNWLVVVGPPEATTARWTSESRRPGTGGEGTLPGERGVFLGDVGYLTAPVEVTLASEGGTLGTVRAGNADRAFSVPWVTEAAPSDGWTVTEGRRSQLSTLPTEFTFPADGRVAVFVRCVGFEPMTMTLGGVRHDVPCDNASHRYEASPTGPELSVRLTGDPYTAYDISLASPS